MCTKLIQVNRQVDRLLSGPCHMCLLKLSLRTLRKNADYRRSTTISFQNVFRNERIGLDSGRSPIPL